MLDILLIGKRTINTLIFPKFSKTGVKKTLSFKRKEDFNVRFSYKVAKSTPYVSFDIVFSAAKLLTL